MVAEPADIQKALAAWQLYKELPLMVRGDLITDDQAAVLKHYLDVLFAQYIKPA